jgi:hypothetical protein
VTTVSATTRGNPLFVQELLHDLVKRGALRRRGGYLAAVGDLGTARLPAELTAVIAARIQPLGERCREVLRLASLLGLRFSLATLAAVSATPEDTLLTLLEEAMQQRLLVSDGPMFEFAHPLVRHVLASEHSGVRVQGMHQRIAEALRRLQPPGAMPWRFPGSTGCDSSRRSNRGSRAASTPGGLATGGSKALPCSAFRQHWSASGVSRRQRARRSPPATSAARPRTGPDALSSSGARADAGGDVPHIPRVPCLRR